MKPVGQTKDTKKYSTLLFFFEKQIPWGYILKGVVQLR